MSYGYVPIPPPPRVVWVVSQPDPPKLAIFGHLGPMSPGFVPYTTHLNPPPPQLKDASPSCPPPRGPDLHKTEKFGHSEALGEWMHLVTKKNTPSYAGPPSLYFAVVGPPGSGRSTAITWALARLNCVQDARQRGERVPHWATSTTASNASTGSHAYAEAHLRITMHPFQVEQVRYCICPSWPTAPECNQVHARTCSDCGLVSQPPPPPPLLSALWRPAVTLGPWQASVAEACAAGDHGRFRRALKAAHAAAREGRSAAVVLDLDVLPRRSRLPAAPVGGQRLWSVRDQSYTSLVCTLPLRDTRRTILTKEF